MHAFTLKRVKTFSKNAKNNKAPIWKKSHLVSNERPVILNSQSKSWRLSAQHGSEGPPASDWSKKRAKLARKFEFRQS